MLERGFKFGKLDLYRSEANDFIIEDVTHWSRHFQLWMVLVAMWPSKLLRPDKKESSSGKTELRKRAGVSQTLVEKMDEMGILGNMPEDNQLSLFDDLF